MGVGRRWVEGKTDSFDYAMERGLLTLMCV
jgi:hypothetical protein